MADNTTTVPSVSRSFIANVNKLANYKSNLEDLLSKLNVLFTSEQDHKSLLEYIDELGKQSEDIQTLAKSLDIVKYISDDLKKDDSNIVTVKKKLLAYENQLKLLNQNLINSLNVLLTQQDGKYIYLTNLQEILSSDSLKKIDLLPKFNKIFNITDKNEQQKQLDALTDKEKELYTAYSNIKYVYNTIDDLKTINEATTKTYTDFLADTSAFYKSKKEIEDRLNDFEINAAARTTKLGSVLVSDTVSNIKNNLEKDKNNVFYSTTPKSINEYVSESISTLRNTVFEEIKDTKNTIVSKIPLPATNDEIKFFTILDPSKPSPYLTPKNLPQALSYIQDKDILVYNRWNDPNAIGYQYYYTVTTMSKKQELINIYGISSMTLNSESTSFIPTTIYFPKYESADSVDRYTSAKNSNRSVTGMIVNIVGQGTSLTDTRHVILRYDEEGSTDRSVNIGLYDLDSGQWVDGKFFFHISFIAEVGAKPKKVDYIKLLTSSNITETFTHNMQIWEIS